MIGFIDDHREAYGVEPICKVLPIAPSTYHKRVAQRHDLSRLSERAKQDLVLKPGVAHVFAETGAPIVEPERSSASKTKWGCRKGCQHSIF